MKNLLVTITFLVTTLFSTGLFAQDAGLSIQGVLRTVEGHAVENGFYQIRFRLYDAAKNGTLIWQETQDSVHVRGGVYSVILGEVNPLNAAFDQKYYLGVSVENGEEMIPRAELTSSPYALSLIGEDNIFPNSGNVGVGDPNPAQKLTIKNGSGRIGLDVEENAGYTSTIIGKENEVSFDNNGSNKDFSFRQNGAERIRVRHHGLNLKGDGSAYFDLDAASSRAFIGFMDANSSIMNIHNINGEIHYTADYNKFAGRLIAYNGLNVQNAHSYFYEKVDVNVNGRSLSTVGTDHSYLAFYPKTIAGGQLGKIGYLTANTNDLSIVNSAANGNVNIHTTNGGKVVINDRLDVNQHLQVSGVANYSMTDYDYINHTGIHQNTGTGNDLPFVLWAAGNIRADVLYADSDQRIKKELEVSNSKNDLEVLNKIEVTDYRHIDEVTNGAAVKKGFIAQQVESVYSEAVSKTKDFIPNIFVFSTTIENNKGLTSISLEKEHGLIKGDRVKLLTDEGIQLFTISELTNAKTFQIEGQLPSGENRVFVYGKEVDDFHTVDYDRIFTLNVSATQELANKVELLEATLAAVKNQNEQLLKERVETQATLNSFSNQLKAMENLFNGITSN